MQKIERFLRDRLKGDFDLIDTKSLIDNSLTYEENQTILNQYINPLLSMEDKLSDLIQQTKHYPITKQFIWKNIRVMFN